jgi:hypothetical protein
MRTLCREFVSDALRLSGGMFDSGLGQLFLACRPTPFFSVEFGPFRPFLDARIDIAEQSFFAVVAGS